MNLFISAMHYFYTIYRTHIFIYTHTLYSIVQQSGKEVYKKPEAYKVRPPHQQMCITHFVRNKIFDTICPNSSRAKIQE